MLGPMALRGRADDAQCVAKAFGAVIKIQAEGRVFDRPVASCQPQDESSTQLLVHAGSLLGDNQWIA